MRRLHLFLLACAAALPAAAETYRWVDPATGRTVLSDQLPPPGVKLIKQTTRAGNGPDTTLPVELRAAVEKFPVTLYVTTECGALCQEARDLLVARGIPFSQKLVASTEDLEEMKKRTGSTAVPVLVVGRQVHAGLQMSAWNQTLDLAGYPNRPAPGYKPPPVPLPPAPAVAATAGSEPPAVGQ